MFNLTLKSDERPSSEFLAVMQHLEKIISHSLVSVSYLPREGAKGIMANGNIVVYDTAPEVDSSYRFTIKPDTLVLVYNDPIGVRVISGRNTMEIKQRWKYV